MFQHTLAKNPFFIFLFLVLGAAAMVACGSSTEEVEMPSQGLITTVVEVQPEEFKIEDERPIPDTAKSLIIAKYLNGTIDTFTLTEARFLQQSGYSGTHGGVFRAASYGFFGYMIGRSMMGGYRPSASAYRDPNTYNRVNNSTGNTIRSTSTRVSRPSSGSKSGFGGSRSTRSFGG
jgi:hypothetical protein